MKLSVDLSEEETKRLETAAKRLGVRSEDLARAALTDLLGRSQEDFQRISQHVLKKNEELYRRLS